MITQYEYKITVLTAGEILARLPGPQADAAPAMVFCDAEGACFFDEAPNPYLGAIVEILNAYGDEGWSLLQVVPRQQDVICFWRRER